jgi:hypothetical protein
MKKNFLAAVVVMIIFVSNASAQKNVSSQDYGTALGVKFYPGAVTLKHFIGNSALEGIGYFWNRGSRITGLYEFHHGIISVPGLKWYVGPGAHIGFYSNKYGGGSVIGVDGVIGLDYKFKGAPINMSVDWQPSFEFGNNYGNGFSGNWGGLAIRYVF